MLTIYQDFKIYLLADICSYNENVRLQLSMQYFN